MALVLFGLSGLVIDAFSKERADIYYARVLEVFYEPENCANDSGNGTHHL